MKLEVRREEGEGRRELEVRREEGGGRSGKLAGRTRISQTASRLFNS
jgi:hypothetical protein